MLHLYPMTFQGFLEGVGDDLLVDYVSNLQISSKPSEAAHQQLWQRLKHYFITGGLPEVVATFAEMKNDLYQATHAVRHKQETLIKAYYADIAKHSGKIKSASTKENMFKLFMFDVGILGAMSGLDPKILLNYDYGSYKGYFAENFVAQQLQIKFDKTIFNWQEDRSEIEFLVQHEGNIIPIEVKAGSIIRAKSLQKFRTKYLPEKSLVFSANPLTVDTKNNVFYLPLYLAERAMDFPH